MTNADDAVHKKLPGPLTIVLVLLWLSVFINYVDRGNLSIAAPMIKDELGLTGSQLGLLLSSFFWTYGFFQMVSGWLVDRFNVNWIMAGGFFLWSAATSVTGVLHGFAALVVVRTVLGIGESVAYPAYSNILARHFPASRRGFANAVIASGLACGPAFGMLLGGTLIARFGWRPFFIALGVVSLLWLAPWFRWMPRGPGITPTHTGPSPSSLAILKQWPVWATFIAHFCMSYPLYLLVTWLPFYLVRERHFSLQGMARIGGGVFLMQAVSSIVSGHLGDRWIADGGTPTRVHKTFMTAGMVGTGTFLVASALVGNGACVVLLLLVGASLGMSLSHIFPMTQRLAGPNAAGRWTGLQCAVGNYSGAAVSTLTGFLLDRTGHFVWAFAVTAGFCCLGMLGWLFLVGPIEPVNWGKKTAGPNLNAAPELA